mgnify:CR=1 FL=1
METNDKFILKPGLKLRKIGSMHMLVETVDGSENYKKIYSLNKTAAWLWDAAGKGGEQTPEALAKGLSSQYDVDYDTALGDVLHQIEEWSEMGIVILK